MLGSAPMRRRPLLHGVLAVTAALIGFSHGSVASAQGQGHAAVPRLPAGVGPEREPVPTGYAGTIRVPQDFATIQAAVDHAKPGGMVLIAPGVYRESVTVTTPYVTIRGIDRGRTIIDGGAERANGIQVFAADGVAIENLTSRNNLHDGVSWHGVHGYWGRYLTAYDNGGSGIAAYGSDDGQLDHSLASGSLHAGFSIQGCAPCRAVITDVIAMDNAAGFSGTNAQGVAVVNSEWTNNRSGIVPNTQDGEAGAPQRGLLIAGNYVHDNDNFAAPALTLTNPSYGMGIVVAGGLDNLVTGNLLEDQRTYGIAVIPILDRNLWPTSGNEVRDNVVRRSGLADLALAAPSSGGDCFAGNGSSTSEPPAIELLYPCAGWRPIPGGGGSPAVTMEALTRSLAANDGSSAPGDRRTQGRPPPQPGMPGDAAAAPPTLAIPGESVPQPYRIRPVGEISSSTGPTVSEVPSVMGLPLATSWWSLLIGLYGYVLPFVLYAAWVAVALWDLIRQESEPIPYRTRWMLVVLVVPFIGPLLYFAFGRSPIPPQLRLILTVGGLAVYALFVLIGVAFGA
jgi:Right handed beta helix region/Phospholipase_D-nuclease N-terminal